VTDAATRQLVLRLLPKRGLVRSVGVSVLLVAVPVFGVLTFLGAHNGTWRIGALGALLTLAVCVFAYLRYRRTSITVTALHIEERGFWGRHHSFARTDAASVDLVHSYSPTSPDPAPQLIARDAGGRCLLRMRGAFWTAEAMHEVADHLEPIVAVHSEAMTAKEFHQRFPGAAYWFEDRPLVMGVIIGVITIIVLAVIFALSAFVGLPVTN